ncbi:hypothetical protein O7627_33575 [Solwaraspora sp. WMMD1047]|uniref:AbiJ-related protein n=1 Tax=Solwaraspora sp. WMMD1047 TaxID=3016102 RepID=UPI002416EFCC|nr:hypothetical protein [Solwaraspora sp. WMMD1047]MDG4834197.1 hypothetical protein [Solwaraspora sp. WMMD1047]
MDLVVLRELLQPVIGSLGSGNTHATLGEACERLGLPTPPEEGTKHERVSASFAALPDSDLPLVARRVLADVAMEARARNAIQDVLWAAESPLVLPTRTRREIARVLDLADVVRSPDRFMALLSRLWVLDDDSFVTLFNPDAGLRGRISRHVIRNPGDWSTEELFDNLGVFEASDRRFALFLEGLACAEVVLDEPTQRAIAGAVNPHLRDVGAELRETGIAGGYPVFSVVSTRSQGNRRPKNLIFASPTKPDIRFRDAIDNEIEIVGDADAVLVYDRPIGADGIRWCDLQAWWKEKHGFQGDDEAKRTLYGRLRRSLPENSPPQILLFDLYHDIFRASVHELPALLPEVWLHWDPKTAKARGKEALLRFRMDFLLLLPRGQRVVLEVDGSQHYSSDGRPDPTAYAANMRADRDLKLSGYEVFRFGAADLQDHPQTRTMVQRFFEDLFRAFGVTDLRTA